MSRDEQLRVQAYEMIKGQKDLVEKDPYRLHYHIMPPVGLMNDPNGFIQWNETYHLFYQWMPFKTEHGAKFWGHFSSEDLINWRHEDIALTPSNWYELNGCYSGSAIEHEGNLYVFYTGNVKDDQGKRESYQCLAVSKDGIHFDKKGPVVNVPEGYTAHFRDPKVWKQDGCFFMVVGAQTTDLKGAIALFRSEDLTTWTHAGVITDGGKPILQDFGFMFECPDMFQLGGKDILIFSPQGLEPKGLQYQNVYQAGYIIGSFNFEAGTFKHNKFDELDRGFDFYAPQTMEDNMGRRLLVAWMGVPDQNERHHPTIAHQWLHNMTLVRELKLVNGKVLQVPAKEMENLRVGKPVEQDVVLEKKNMSLADVNGKAVELMLQNVVISKGWFSFSIGGAASVIYSKDQRIFTLERQSYVDGITEKRQCYLENLNSLNIFIDTSSIEIFINGGEQTFTTRFYPATNNNCIEFNASKRVTFTIQNWNLNNTATRL